MANSIDLSYSKGGIAVYCGSSIGAQKAYANAAQSVGRALAQAKRPLIYGGGAQGLMGIVSGSTLASGGDAIGIVPYAIHVGGGEREKSVANGSLHVESILGASVRAKHEKIVVDSMHERKVQMAKRSVGFIGLPGGFGSFEEVMEVATWTQLGIHDKPVVMLNVLGFYEPLRQLIQNGITEGFINAANYGLVIFVDGPEAHDEHEAFDWGNAAVKAVESWQPQSVTPKYDWSKRLNGTYNTKEGALAAT
ncbi:hypothetical protein BDZ94DRAFT_1176017 [Collybia nuda]|uniref:Cytokinin riboside 5'-monophosphate phosphoribohydrolase n=1 Tax=Collybia nuda TaxID=64659 RepID=A0A9P5XTD8_9AGAR|nr:hypothetical protein BDZ94DRAFT_1176017 [Collybia nuda]